MDELFIDISEEKKRQIESCINLALQQPDPKQASLIIINYIASLKTLREKDFGDFYFKLKLEQLKNENNSN